MDELITLVNWTIFILFTGFALGLGFGGAWRLWGLGKNTFVYKWPEHITLALDPKKMEKEEQKCKQ